MILKKHILTEKVFTLNKADSELKYCFLVDESANKITVKNEIEKFFGVVVNDVNILNNNKKNKRFFLGKKSFTKEKKGGKKAYVTLKKGYSINLENSI